MNQEMIFDFLYYVYRKAYRKCRKDEFRKMKLEEVISSYNARGPLTDFENAAITFLKKKKWKSINSYENVYEVFKSELTLNDSRSILDVASDVSNKLA